MINKNRVTSLAPRTVVKVFHSWKVELFSKNTTHIAFTTQDPYFCCLKFKKWMRNMDFLQLFLQLFVLLVLFIASLGRWIEFIPIAILTYVGSSWTWFLQRLNRFRSMTIYVLITVMYSFSTMACIHKWAFSSVLAVLINVRSNAAQRNCSVVQKWLWYISIKIMIISKGVDELHNSATVYPTCILDRFSDNDLLFSIWVLPLVHFDTHLVVARNYTLAVTLPKKLKSVGESYTSIPLEEKGFWIAFMFTQPISTKCTNIKVTLSQQMGWLCGCTFTKPER